MDKKIEDYLHLYLGCEFVLKIKDTDNYSAPMTFGVDALAAASFPQNSDFRITPILILRPLVSLTLEEDQVIFPANNRGHKIDMHWFPEGFAWLLKNQFDLFGLIESGLAISKVEVSNPLKTQDEK